MTEPAKIENRVRTHHPSLTSLILHTQHPLNLKNKSNDDRARNVIGRESIILLFCVKMCVLTRRSHLDDDKLYNTYHTMLSYTLKSSQIFENI